MHPEGARAKERMRRLSITLRELAREAPARRAAVYVQDIETGLAASVNPNRLFVAASLIKLPVMAAAYDLWEKRPGLKTRRALAWMEQMVTVSDNASTDRLIDLVGGPEVVTRFCSRRGWPNLKTRHAIINHRGRRGLNQCTAREIAQFLVALDQRRLVGQKADHEMWGVLRRQKKRARIPGGLPDLPDLQVGNKTGTLNQVLHDAGIVRTSQARYALCILLERQRSDWKGDAFCRRVSRAVFDAFHDPAAPETETARGR
jgi:beta-lactamase class A